VCTSVVSLCDGVCACDEYVIVCVRVMRLCVYQCVEFM
jgi:hypothetical protein